MPKQLSKKLAFDPSGEPGIFFGYFLQPGGVWTKDYLVARLADFIDKDVVPVHRVRDVVFPEDDTPEYPLQIAKNKAFSRALEDAEFIRLTQYDRDHRAGGIVKQLTDEEAKRPHPEPIIDAAAFEPELEGRPPAPPPVVEPPLAVEMKPFWPPRAGSTRPPDI